MLNLTEEQFEAVNNIEGKVCLKAGAGTGKTFVLTSRYIQILNELIKKNYKIEDAVSRIIAVTFTNKAAGQMRKRIIENLSDIADISSILSNAHISTIDAFCVRILKENAFQIGFDPDFKIMDVIESKLLFLKEAKNIFDTEDLPLISLEMSLDGFLGNVYSFIHRLKNNAIMPGTFKENIENSNITGENKKLGEIIFHLYAAYENKLKNENKFDFQKILLEGLLLLENKKVKERYKDFFKYVLVDEYQDTTFLQDKLLRELASYSGNYFVVGDINQSIYAFRDARPENIIDFDREAAKEGKSLSLTNNFRSYREILEMSNRCFSVRMPYFQNLCSEKEKKEKCAEFYLARDAEEEAEFIAQRILALLENNKNRDLSDKQEDNESSLQCKDIVILFRNIKKIGIYEETLYKHHLPFITIGGSGYYLRPEIRDIISLLSIINNPFDDLSLVRILRGPLYRISNSVLYKLANLNPVSENEEEDTVRKQKYPIFDALEKTEHLDITEQEKDLLCKLRKFIEEFILKKHEMTLSYFVYALIRQSGYLNYIQTLPFIDRKRSMANIYKFYELVSRFEERNLFPVLGDFIAYIKEVTAQETIESEEPHELENVIQLMTIHQAKGLEFPVVFVANISPNNFPPKARPAKYYFDLGEGFLNADDEEDKKRIKELYKEQFESEEERLLYVAMTRPERRLILSGIVKETGRGMEKSSFIDYFFDKEGEIKEEYAELLIDANKVFPIRDAVREKEYRQDRPALIEKEIDIEEMRNYFNFKYSFVKEKKTKKSFNVTELAVFKNCPLQYKFRYALGIVPKEAGEEKKDGEAITGAGFGMVMHKILEELVLFGQQEKWGDKKIYEQFEKLARAYGMIEKNIAGIYENKVRKIIEDFLEGDYSPRKRSVKKVEAGFHLNIEGFLIKGTIDRIDYLDKGGFEIIDYKTGKNINPQKYNLPMNLYNIGAEQILDFVPVTGLIVYYLQENEWASLKMADKDQTLNEVKSIISKINNKDYSRDNESDKNKCIFCEYRKICETI